MNNSDMITLEQLGTRISIIGCSNSGKSTLANALAKKLHIAVYHLDQYAHFEKSKWVRKSDDTLINAHCKILKKDTWIIDGNYSICMPSRLDLATSVIWLDPNIYSSLWRFICRSLKNDPNRPGRLAGAKNEFNLSLVKWIIFNYPKNRLKYQEMLKSRPNLLVVRISSLTLLKKYYVHWGL